MTDVVALPRARVPIVKFHHPDYEVNCDISINNRLAILNTRLLSIYASVCSQRSHCLVSHTQQIDPRVVPLARTIKQWTKARNINSPYSGNCAYLNDKLHAAHTNRDTKQLRVSPAADILPPDSP